MYPVVGKSAANWGMGSVAVADDFTICPFSVPTVIGVLLCPADHVVQMGQYRGELPLNLQYLCDVAEEYFPVAWDYSLN